MLAKHDPSYNRYVRGPRRGRESRLEVRQVRMSHVGSATRSTVQKHTSAHVSVCLQYSYTERVQSNARLHEVTCDRLAARHRL